MSLVGRTFTLAATWPLLLGLERGARADCATRSVVLEIQAEPPEAVPQRELEEHVAAELRSSDFSLCPASDASASLARVRVRATSTLERALLRVQLPRSTPLERSIDVGALPPEARPLAIASATDELLRAALATPARSRGGAPLEPTTSAALGPARDDPAALMARPTATAGGGPRVEIGLAGSASGYAKRREALGGDALARFWLRPRLALSAGVGASARLTRPPERGSVQADAEQHVALGAAFDLWPNAGPFALLATAALQLSHVGFDEQLALSPAAGVPQLSVDGDVPGAPPAEPLRVRTYGLDHVWALAGSLGLEGMLRSGPFGFGAALAALLPLSPARSDWGSLEPGAADGGALDTVGAELRLAVWFALGAGASPSAELASSKPRGETP